MLLLVTGVPPGDLRLEQYVDMLPGDLPIPGREEFKICELVDQKIQKGVEIFSGRGRKLLDDRVYVREKLREVAQNPTLACVLKECIVYAPSDVLEEVELLDVPGAGSDDPAEQVCPHTNRV